MTRPLMRWQLVAALTVLAALIVALWLLQQRPVPEAREPARERTVAVDVITVQPGVRAVPVTSHGVVQSARQVVLVARVSGAVVEANPAFRDGGMVTEGELLLSQDPEPYELALARQRHEASAARLHLADTRARAQVARRTNGEQASEYARLVPHMDEAQGRLAAAEAGVRDARRKLAETQLKAPFAGRLRDVQVQPGQQVAAGERLATLYSTHSLEVRLPVRDDWLALLDMPLHGSPGEHGPEVVLVGRFGGQTGRWSGRIVRREGGLNDNRMIYLVAQVELDENSSVPLEPGMLVEATLRGRQAPDLVRLPRSVLAGAGHIWRVDDDERLRRLPVTPVYQDADAIYLRTSSLASGDRIALSGGLRWPEGTRVQARPFGRTLDISAGDIHPGDIHAGEAAQ
ncbi:efflux RND transporter periplasmic adaptor subunit [Isoalcanivorax indicus]|uniref:efflux RND transporter periplasmic adaptor subunit n=1 Tax=Isoalcanivorax indicus TaxID=2202653 RepID=UPI0013C4A3D4|nr:efflux RND transporter periplasmic adaptor subunit [Isoalcanivorax indicus]